MKRFGEVFYLVMILLTAVVSFVFLFPSIMEPYAYLYGVYLLIVSSIGMSLKPLNVSSVRHTRLIIVGIVGGIVSNFFVVNYIFAVVNLIASLTEVPSQWKVVIKRMRINVKEVRQEAKERYQDTEIEGLPVKEEGIAVSAELLAGYTPLNRSKSIPLYTFSSEEVNEEVWTSVESRLLEEELPVETIGEVPSYFRKYIEGEEVTLDELLGE